MKRPLPLAYLALAALAACGPTGSDDDISVEQALDAVEISQHESALVVASMPPLDVSSTAELAALAAAKAAPLAFLPEGCVSTEVQGTAITYTLKGCTGPFRTRLVTGKLEVVYSLGASGLHAQLTARDLRVGGVTLDVDSEGLFSIDGVERRASVKTHGAGVDRRGNRVERDGAYTLTWDPVDDCLGFDGVWETQVLARKWQTQVEGIERCAGACPAAGGRIVYEEEPLGPRLEITFDGNDAASWTSSQGESGVVALLCAAGV